MVLVIVQIGDQSTEAAWFQNMGFLELQSYAAGILDNSPAIQGVYITLMCFVLLGRADSSFISQFHTCKKLIVAYDL